MSQAAKAAEPDQGEEAALIRTLALMPTARTPVVAPINESFVPN
jgi:hypothetical protein